jgi:hypothetical protein
MSAAKEATKGLVKQRLLFKEVVEEARRSDVFR